jgi:hypothetical protein
MENDIWVSISWKEESNKIQFFFFRGDKESEIIADFALTPKQLLEVFQQTGIDFWDGEPF